MRLAWAFNPFDDDRKLQRKAVAIAKALIGPKDELEAVYVASPNEVAIAAAFDVPAAQRFTQYPKQRIEAAVAKLGLARIRASVLPQRDLSLTSSVRILSAYLERHGVDLVLVASHARTGVPRLFLGSFAETLVHVSRTDLLVFNEGSRVWKKRPETLLFAHDLSADGERGFEKAIRWARQWGCSLHVVHVPDPAYSLRFDDQDKRVEAQRKQIGAKIRRVEARLQRAGVGGSVTIAAEWAPIAELVLAHARRVHAELVVVTAKSGRLAGLMGGSVTRQILRTSVSPVLVLKSGPAD